MAAEWRKIETWQELATYIEMYGYEAQLCWVDDRYYVKAGPARFEMILKVAQGDDGNAA
jgi:hypothetical protein